jgi:hypothetical protein
MNDIRKQIVSLAQVLNYLDYAPERQAKFGGFKPPVDPQKILKHGIADLDFDPYFFLQTEQTSPEGWATAKK